jgi:hypothetical protein
MTTTSDAIWEIPLANPANVNKIGSIGSIGTKSQGLTKGRTINLTDFADQAFKADITTKGDAAYINNIGFYIVKDALTGVIDIGGGVTLKPGDANYAKAAVTIALTSPNTFAVEDQFGSGDKDFNDLVVNMSLKPA